MFIVVCIYIIYYVILLANRLTYNLPHCVFRHIICRSIAKYTNKHIHLRLLGRTDMYNTVILKFMFFYR